MQKKPNDLITELFDSIRNGTFHYEKTEDDFNQAFEQSKCPYDLCDGSGYTVSDNKSVDCRCFKEKVLQKKLENANIPTDFWKANWKQLEELDHLEQPITLTYLKPKPVQGKRKVDKRHKKGNEPPETPQQFIDRTYDAKKRDSLVDFAKGFSKHALLKLNEKPRTDSFNLLLLGDPGKGKTLMASLIATDFLQQDKSVYFIRIKTFIDEAYEQKAHFRSIVRKKDLLIIDELFQEYHTDTGWALTQIQDVIKERQELKLPTIVTTNAFPNELSELYEGSLMSTFHGEYIIGAMEGEVDVRIYFGRQKQERVDFLQ
ncbi:ATP-binding protein (plasmid) [Pontibacillus sp. ALD_SL1]|uniref:ATP-binding protein n=1 Tax=Pontibacillus sp. ALD_SL1 TaxID=2777185 RepID=UPI001A96D4FE|nr:ATP-binding protein [Pontibacillus sp. ALD_SL1]QST02972.1 ATP-binding protein [Pontibacillus sp. ALD_SL1]